MSHTIQIPLLYVTFTANIYRMVIGNFIGNPLREHSYMTSDVFRAFLTYLPKKAIGRAFYIPSSDTLLHKLI